MKLIDKDALVAELKRRIQKSLDDGGATRGVYLSERMKEDSHILSFLDTLEVKEMDLDEAARKWEDKVYLEKGWQDEYGTPHAPFSEIGNAFREGARFMLKAQKGE